MAILRLSLLVFLLGTGLCHAQFMIFENIEPYVETIEFVFEENKPFAQCHASSIEKKRVWNAFVDRSDDRGESWLNSETLILDRKLITGEGVIQPALWESSPGNVHMLLRTSTGKIGRSDSKDYGRTWTPVELIDLPNNNSGIDVAQIQGETLALAFNPVGKNWGARYPMELAISQDNGLTWPIRKVIENGSEDNEFSYPSLIFEEGYLVLCYTWNRENIRFVKLRLNGN